MPPLVDSHVHRAQALLHPCQTLADRAFLECPTFFSQLAYEIYWALYRKNSVESKQSEDGQRLVLEAYDLHFGPHCPHSFVQ